MKELTSTPPECEASLHIDSRVCSSVFSKEGSTTAKAFDTHSSDWPRLCNFPVSAWTAETRRTRLDLENQPVYEINSSGGCISSVNLFTSLSKQIGQIRLLIDTRDVSATGCDHTGHPLLLVDHDSTLTVVGSGVSQVKKKAVPTVMTECMRKMSGFTLCHMLFRNPISSGMISLFSGDRTITENISSPGKLIYQRMQKNTYVGAATNRWMMMMTDDDWIKHHISTFPLLQACCAPARKQRTHSSLVWFQGCLISLYQDASRMGYCSNCNSCTNRSC